MSQVSRLPLPKALQEQTFTLFRKVLADLHSEKDIADFLDDLLSPTEKIMLGKRLAIAFLLERGYDQREIHNVLKVSTTTVNSVNYWYRHKGNGYRKVIGMVRKAQQWKEFRENLGEELYKLFSVRAQRRRGLFVPDKEVKTEVKL